MKTLTSLLLCVVTLFATSELCAQNIRPSSRARVIIDNDFSGDPDGLVALAHQLLSPSIETTAIIGSYVNRGWSKNSGNPARDAVEAVDELLAVMGRSGEYKVYQGSATTMTDPNTPIESEGDYCRGYARRLAPALCIVRCVAQYYRLGVAYGACYCR